MRGRGVRSEAATRGRLAVAVWPATALLMGCGTAEQPREAAATPDWAGAILVQPIPKPALILTDDLGHPFDLAAQTRGRVTLLYFGYTHCPDVCPTTMADTTLALRKLAPEVRRQVAVVFVTTDPKRDSPVVLHNWLSQFDATFVGLTGNTAQIQTAEKAAGVPPSAIQRDSNGRYGVDHAAYVIAYTKDGLAHITYPAGVKPADEARDLDRLVRSGWSD